MTFSELKKTTSKNAGYTYQVTSEILDTAYTAIVQTLMAGESFDVYGFGGLNVKTLAERVVDSPVTGHHIVPEHRVLKLKVSPVFKKKLNGGVEESAEESAE